MNHRLNLQALTLALLMTLTLGAGVAQLAQPGHVAAHLAQAPVTQPA